MKRSKTTAIKISFFGILMLLALAVSHSYLSFAAIAAASIHEVSHIALARLLGTRLSSMRLGIFGASLSMDSHTTSYKNEILIALAGPLANLTSAIIILLFVSELSAFTEMFLAASIFLGLLNLLPISDFDGGRILFCIIAIKSSLHLASTVLKLTSFFFVFSLWTLSVYLILRLGASLSLFVFSASVFCTHQRLHRLPGQEHHRR